MTTRTEQWVRERSAELEGLHPSEILRWCFEHLEGVFATTAFQPGGIVLLDLLHRSGRRPPVLFVDTLHHFPETLELAAVCKARFDLDLRVGKPGGCSSAEEFARIHGEALWDRDLDLYQKLTKVDPLRALLDEVRGECWISARRRDQGGERGELPVLEISGDRIKVNPLAAWTRKEVWGHLLSNELPYNPLHDQGYPSIGDAPLTEPADASEGERSGRWKGRGKTECGIHTM